jgi:uncharacterized protein (DUF1015 family)
MKWISLVADRRSAVAANEREEREQTENLKFVNYFYQKCIETCQKQAKKTAKLGEKLQENCSKMKSQVDFFMKISNFFIYQQQIGVSTFFL